MGHLEVIHDLLLVGKYYFFVLTKRTAPDDGVVSLDVCLPLLSITEERCWGRTIFYNACIRKQVFNDMLSRAEYVSMPGGEMGSKYLTSTLLNPSSLRRGWTGSSRDISQYDDLPRCVVALESRCRLPWRGFAFSQPRLHTCVH